MPIGQADIAVAGGNANLLVESLFTPPTVRAYLTPLIQVANPQSANNAAAGMPYLAPAVGAGAAPNPLWGGLINYVSLLNPNELNAMINGWWQAWDAAILPGALLAEDINLLTMISAYVANPAAAGAIPMGGIPAAGFAFPAFVNPLDMWVPQLAYDGMQGEQLKLRLIRYQNVPLADVPNNQWIAANVWQLLTLLAFGAHFVVVHAPRDLAALAVPALQPFYDEFGTLLGAQARAAKSHSHYAGLGPITSLGAAYTYPNAVNAETAPINCPYIVAFLVGRTAWSLFGNEYNTFFQLEGWPTTGYTGIGGRHLADYSTHSATKWNISTFGASIYSEKRGATIFLAPAGWNPQSSAANPATIMAPYVGAETPQGWLDTKLVRA